MLDFLLKKFIKNYDKYEDSKVRKNYGLFASIFGLICNILLFIIKYFVGFLFNNVAIIADSINNLSDSLSNGISLISFKLSSKPADKDHPFGHERIEYISTVIVAFIILIIAYELIKESILKIINYQPLEFSFLLIVVLIISILIKYLLYYVNKKIAKKINSKLLLATASDSLNDILSSGSILLAIIISYFTKINLDGFIGVFVSILVLKSGIDILKDTFDNIIGKAPDKEFEDRIKNYVLSYQGILGVHDMIIHQYGPNKSYVSLHAEVDANTNILISHDTIDRIEKGATSALNIFLVIHMDPIVIDNPIINTYRKQIERVITSINKDISMHDFRAVLGKTHDNLIFDIARPLEVSVTDKYIEDKIKEELYKQYKKEINLVITFDILY